MKSFHNREWILVPDRGQQEEVGRPVEVRHLFVRNRRSQLEHRCQRPPLDLSLNSPSQRTVSN